MKTLVLALLLAISPFAAAQEPGAEPATAAAEPAADTVPISAADTAAETDADPTCLRDTGTRTPHRDEDGCNGLPGESYDKEQIDRTGAVDTADAIRRLSPSATIRH